MAQVGILYKYKPESFPRMALARKTLQDLMGQQRTIKVTTITSDEFSFHKMCPVPYWLRLVLLPKKLHELGDVSDESLRNGSWIDFPAPDVHYIDNIEICYQRDPDDSIRRGQVSFLLPENHGLERTHGGIIVDLMTGSIVDNLGPIEGMWQQEYCKPFPIYSCSPTNEALLEDFHMQILLKLHLLSYYSKKVKTEKVTVFQMFSVKS